MKNGWEIQYGFDPYNPSDAIIDGDGDHRSNRVEYTENTNPLVPDTFEASYMFNNDGFKQDEGFVLNVITEYASGFTMKIATSEGEQTVYPGEYTGTGAAEDPFAYNWKPGSPFTEQSGGWCFISASQPAAMPYIIRIFGAIIAGLAAIKKFRS